MNGRVLMGRAASWLQNGELQTLSAACQETLQSAPAVPEAHFLLAVAAFRRGQQAAGEQHIDTLLTRLAADTAVGQDWRDIAIAMAHGNDPCRAYELYTAALAGDGAALKSLALLLGSQGAVAAALRLSRAAVARWPQDAESHDLLSRSLRLHGEHDAALEHSRTAVRLDPANVRAHITLATILRERGQLEAARASYEQALRLGPEMPELHYALAAIKTYHDPADPQLLAMEAAHAAASLPAAKHLYLCFALGKAYGDLGRYDQAFARWREGNDLKRRLEPYDIAHDQVFFSRLQRVFDASFFDRCRGYGVDDRRPIFIVGMPRSGTTLVEQILSSHSQVDGAGELPELDHAIRGACAGTGAGDTLLDCLGGLDNDAIIAAARAYLAALAGHQSQGARVTDKMPANFLWLGMIRVMFPAARVIHCRRDAVDTCLSCYQQLFTGDIRFSYDLSDLGAYYRLYAALMRHWQGLLPGFILDVQYEKLVAAPREETRRLLAFCELPWEEGCLDFHGSTRIIRTASVAQVREKIYASSVHKWHRYAQHLDPLLAALGDDYREEG